MLSLIRSFLNILYPEICIACKEDIEEGHHLLCKICQQKLVLLDPKEHCPTCFGLQDGSYCNSCSGTTRYFSAVAAAFNYEEPASTLVKSLKYAKNYTLAKGLGSFLAVQFINLEWPVPDLIVPVPTPISRRLERGYNQSFLLAEALAQNLNVPCKEILSKSNRDMPQAALNSEQRKDLYSQTITLKKKNHIIEDKVILLVDDVITTGNTFNISAKTLLAGHPKSLYGISVCKSLI